MTVPGFTTQVQNSGSALPVPMRVSAGFLLTDLCGKIRIQTLASGALREHATRPASSVLAGIQPGSRDCRPKSPKATVLPRVALPRITPRICLRNLTRLGMRAMRHLLAAGWTDAPVLETPADSRIGCS